MKITSNNQDTFRLILGEHSPYYDKSLPNSGKVPEIITRLLAKKDIRTEYRWASWKDAFQQIETGRFHGSFIHLQKVDDCSSFYVSDPILKNETVFFYNKKSDVTCSSLSELKGFRSGGTLRAPYPASFLKAAEDGHIQIDWLTDDTLNFKLLLQGKIDVFPISKEIGLHKLNTYFSPNERAKLTWSNQSLCANPVRLILSKKYESNLRILQLVNDGLQHRSLC